MDLSLLIRQRLEQLGLGQRDLAAAAQVTESYISQLFTVGALPTVEFFLLRTRGHKER